MNKDEIINTLHTLERKLIPYLKTNSTPEQLVKESGLQEVEVLRVIQWLENKEIIKIITKENNIIIVSEKGKPYEELPERILVTTLLDKPLSLEEIKQKTKLTDQEINVAIGRLARLSLIARIEENGIKKFKCSGLHKETEEEHLFKRIKNKDTDEDFLTKEEKITLKELINRGLLTINKIKHIKIELTELGRELSKIKIDTDVIESLTQEIIKNKEWEKKKFRAYDITSELPQIYRGKRHFVNQGINYMKRIWLDMGFREMTGELVQTAFWNMDTLFVPQDHPAREMQDTFYVGTKEKILQGKIPEKLSKIIKEVHENGWTTGSKGWGGKWDIEKSKEVLLRTHTTALSSRTISKLKKEDLPIKYFAIGKVFRNEALDWKHLFELQQVEGIVVDPDANLRNLLGYLKEFAKKMGYPEVKFRPSFFPYTEPSVEGFIWNEQKKQWVEVIAAGIFRPEVTKALLGFECPILAWGPGMERILVNYYKITDIREMYKNDIKQLREIKEFIK